MGIILSAFMFMGGMTLFSSKALAQESEQAEEVKSQPASNTYTMPTIMVTVEKRKTDAQKTPLPLTVISSQKLEDAGIVNINDLLNHIPNLYSSEGFAGSTMMSFRGIPSSSVTNVNPLVIYVDGIPVETFLSLNTNLMDIERVEVLRGAQSVIYGKNAFGGIINIISKKPTNELRGKITTRFESYNGGNLGATVSGPIKEDLLYFALSAEYGQSDGYIDTISRDESNSNHSERAKGQLRLTPTDKSEFAFHFEYNNIHEKPAYIYYPKAFTTHPQPNFSDKSLGLSSDFIDTEALALGLTGKIEFDSFIAESVTTYRNEVIDYQINFAPISPMATNSGRLMKNYEATQEFRIRSLEKKGSISWLAGIYGAYGDNDTSISQDYEKATGLQMDQYFRQYTKEFAPFAQVEIPFADAFKINLGLRWHYIHKSASLEYDPSTAFAAFYGPAMQTNIKDSWNEFLPRLMLSYEINDDIMVYGGISRSFVAGGFNYASTSPDNITFDSQTAWNYEIGTKTSWLDNRLTANVTMFYSKFDDLQIGDYVAPNWVAKNAGKATSYGAELDLAFRIMKGLDADASLGYTHAEYDDYTMMGINYSGNTIQYTPEFTGIFGLQYRHDSGLFIRGEAIYADKMYWDVANKASRDAIWTVNAKIGYEMEDFDVYLYGRNILNERYLSTYGTGLGVANEPQIFGLELSYRF